MVSGSGSSTCFATATSSRPGSSPAVRGAGAYYDGVYYVKSVTHNIKRGEYKQSFTLRAADSDPPCPTVSRMNEGAGSSTASTAATVVNNVDPHADRAASMVIVPDVLGGVTPSTWAMPCVPLAGKQMGIFLVPQIGAGVWVEFEQGDPDYPIWTGGCWGSAAEVPALGAGRRARRIRTSSCRPTRRTRSSISDLARPDRRHHAEEHHRRDDHRQRHRHLHPERQGSEHRS